MNKGAADILGAMAAVFVGTLVLDVWLGGGFLGALSPWQYDQQFRSFGGGMAGGSVATQAQGSAQPIQAQASAGGAIASITVN